MNETPRNKIIQTEHIQGNQFTFECHLPSVMEVSHFHGHIEMIFFTGCEADYLINGASFHVNDAQPTIFWANIPHKLTNLKGHGLIYIANIPLAEFLALSIPQPMRDNILQGKVLQADHSVQINKEQFKRWHTEWQINNDTLNKIIQDEIGIVLRRLSLQDWTQVCANLPRKSNTRHISLKGLQHVSKMVAYINQHIQEPVTTAQVSGYVGLQPNYALTLFSSIMRITIKQYVLQQRLELAQKYLMKGNQKITTIAFECGFGSISRFYDVFTQHFGMSPSKFRKHFTVMLSYSDSGLKSP